MSEEHVLFGKYRLYRKLGSGRSGTVYLACHMELDELRAVKIVPKKMSDYDSFKKEALFLKTLRHPGILGIPIIPCSPSVLQRRQPGSLFKLPAEGRGIRKTTGIGDFRDIPS